MLPAEKLGWTLQSKASRFFPRVLARVALEGDWVHKRVRAEKLSFHPHVLLGSVLGVDSTGWNPHFTTC